MPRPSFKIEIEGREYLIPDDLDLNDAILLEKMDETVTQTEQLRFIVWRLLLEDNPEITEEEAGKRIKFSTFLKDEDEAEEAPPAIPLPVPAPQSGTSSGSGNGNGSTDTSVVEVTHAPGGHR